jgi:hypothetical protein
LFVVVFGVLFEAGFQPNHNMFEAQKTANNAAGERYEPAPETAYKLQARSK